jgi:sigma-B regulation protein RsbU (phosphoserine phosphatase)
MNEPTRRDKQRGQAKPKPPKPKAAKELTLEEQDGSNIAPQPTSTILEGMKKAGTTGRKRKSGGNLAVGSGMSLRLKFALFISTVAASLCLFSQLFLYFRVQKELLTEIDRKGAALVRSTSALAQEYQASLTSNEVEEWRKAQATYEQQRANSRLSSETDKELQTKIRELGNKISEYKQQSESKFRGHLNRLVIFEIKSLNKDQVSDKIFSEEILQAGFVRPGNPDIILLQSGDKNNRGENSVAGLSGTMSKLLEKIGSDWCESNISLIEGRMTTRQGSSLPVRAYRIPVVAGELDAMVTLSEQDIVRTLNSIFYAILVTAIVAIAFGIGIAFLLAQQVTEPLQRLVYDMEVVAEGNLDHSTVAVSRDEIGILASTFNVMTKNLKKAHMAELETEVRKHELEVAKEIQANLLPSHIPELPGYDIGSFYQAAKEVGGDYYDFIEIDKHHLGFVVADVSGKSIPGSIIMGIARALIRIEALRTLSPAQTFAGVNRILSQDIRKGMFVTAMYGVLDVRSGEVLISSAGHNPAIVWRQAQKQNQIVNPKGMALGLSDKPAIFNKAICEEKLQLQPGDRVVFYTDGVPEAMSSHNEEFGDNRLCDIVAQDAAQESKKLIEHLVKDIGDWRKGCPQSDDITIVTFRKI